MKKFISPILHTFRPLKVAVIRTYMSGQAVSLLGTWMQQTAQSWVVWQLTGSTSSLGIVALVGQIPFFFLGPWTGVWADRWDRKKILVYTQTISMLLAFALAILVQTHLIQIWHVYIMAFLLGVVSALDMPAQQAFIGDIAGKENIKETIVLNTTFVQISRMVGPAFAGWTVAALGVSTAFWLNGVSFLAVIFSLLIIKSTQVKKEHTGNTLDGFKEGIATLASNRMMRDLILFTMFVTFFGFSIVQLLPAVASRLLHGDASTLGLLMGSSGAGALVGTLLLVPLLQKIKHSGYAIGGAIIWSGFCYFLFSFSTSIHISMLFQFAASMGASIVFTMSNGLLQMLAPHAMRARILSTWLMISFGAQPIAALIVGYLADRIGLAEMVRINGALMMICAASLLWLEPIIRRFTATFRLKEISENFAPAQIDTIAQGGQSVECEES